MKKLVVIMIILFAGIIVISFGRVAMDPADYTGEWYSANGQSAYLFQEGIICCQRNGGGLGDMSSFGGAYNISKDSILLFVIGVDGLETEKELYLVKNKGVSLLCDNKDGNGRIYFIRAN